MDFSRRKFARRASGRGFVLSRSTAPIAHVGFPKTHRVGKYGVDIGVIDEAAELLTPDAGLDIYLVDEIGKMECLSARFIAAGLASALMLAACSFPLNHGQTPSPALIC